MTEDASAFNCGTVIAISVAMQLATLMFEEVRKFPLWGTGLFFVSTIVFQEAHDWLGVSWRVLFGCSIVYFFATMGAGQYFANRRRRRHEARMVEMQAKHDEFIAECENATRKLRGEVEN